MLRAWLWAALMAVTLGASRARAAEDPPARLTQVQFGFGDGSNLQYEHWGPLRVTIDAVKRPFSGTLVISYPQDPTQGVVLRVPAAGTPGIATPVEALVCLKTNASSLNVTLLDERGKQVDRLRFGNVAEDPDAAPLLFDQREGMVLCLGRVSPDRAVVPLDLPPNPQDYLIFNQPQQWTQQRLDENREHRLRSLRAVAVEPLALPAQWAAYDTAEAVVVRTEELTTRIAPASREAIMRWVTGGGRLVLVVDQAGDLWRTWLPGQFAALVAVGEPTRIPVPQFLADALSTPDRVAERAIRAVEQSGRGINAPVPGDATPDLPATPDDESSSDEVTSVEPPQDVDAAPASTSGNLGGPLSTTEKSRIFAASHRGADTFSGRPITLHSSLVNGGWRSEAAAGQPSILVHGPVGLGYVTILSADPSLAAAEPGPEPSRRAWLRVLAFGLEDWISLPSQPSALRQAWWGGWNGATSGGDDLQRQAITQELNHIADRPGRTLNPTAVLGALLACAFLLAVLLGPVDGLVLGLKRKLHWSWATALVWIVLISIIAGFVPWLLRGDLPTMRMSRSLENVVIDQAGSSAWRSTVHGLFAAQPGERDLLANPRSMPSGSVFRGIGVGNNWDTREAVFSSLGLMQSTTLSPRGSETSIWPIAVSQGQWSLRNLFSFGPLSAEEDPQPVRARVVRTGPRELRVECEGLSSGSESGFKVRKITLRHQNLSDAYEIELPGQDVAQAAYTRTVKLDHDVLGYAEREESRELRMQAFDPARSHAQRRGFGQIHDLPGVQRHDLAIAARLATGRWALIEVAGEDETLGTQDGERALSTHSRIVQILVPIEGSATPLSDDGANP